MPNLNVLSSYTKTLFKETFLKKLFLLPLFFLFIFPVTAQEADPQYFIDKVIFETDHYTRVSALERVADIRTDRSFASLTDLIKYLDGKTQDLINLRVFEDVYYTMQRVEHYSNETSYIVTFHVIGAWTLYPIPMPKYDSNTGLRIVLKTYYNNFFGTLMKFYVGTNIDFMRVNGDITVPQWTINPELSDIRIGRLNFNTGFAFRYQTETQYDTVNNVYLKNYSFYSTSFNFGTSFDTPWGFSLRVSPNFTWYSKYTDNLPADGSNIQEKKFDFRLGNSISVGQLNWNGNFREGWGASFSYSIGVDVPEKNKAEFASSIGLSHQYFYIWKRLNPSAQLSANYRFNGGDINQGGALRGVRDNELNGIAGIFLNTDLNISVIPWKGVGEAQFKPFFDIGLAWRNNEDFDQERGFKYSVGADFILYIDKLKGMVARASIGVNLSDYKWSEGRKYEISIESSLHY